MYVSRQHFVEESRALEIAGEIGVGELVTNGPNGLNATRLPFIVRQDGERTIIETHVARVNPQIHDSGEALLIVTGPDAHVPGHYLPAEPDGARMPYVPTWNYLTVHLRGELTIHDIAEWKLRHLEDFVSRHEPEWRVETHSSTAKVTRALGALVGLSIDVTNVLGKAKLHQNMSSHYIEHIARNLDSDERQIYAGQVAGLMRDIAVPWAQSRESRVHHVLRSRDHAGESAPEHDEGSY